MGLVVVSIAAAFGLAACGGASDSPHVARLGTSAMRGVRGGSTSTTSVSKGGNATQLMDEWAACMPANGDPDQRDPTIDQYDVINITIPLGASDSISLDAHGSTGPCSQYELAAENDLRARIKLRQRRPRPDGAVRRLYADPWGPELPQLRKQRRDRFQGHRGRPEQSLGRERQQGLRQADQRASVVDCRNRSTGRRRGDQRRHRAQWPERERSVRWGQSASDGIQRRFGPGHPRRIEPRC